MEMASRYQHQEQSLPIKLMTISNAEDMRRNSNRHPHPPVSASLSGPHSIYGGSNGEFYNHSLINLNWFCLEDTSRKSFTARQSYENPSDVMVLESWHIPNFASNTLESLIPLRRKRRLMLRGSWRHLSTLHDQLTKKGKEEIIPLLMKAEKFEKIQCFIDFISNAGATQESGALE